MKEILISDSELDELILILQMSSYDADVAARQSHDIEEVDALREHKTTVTKWLNRFLQLKADQEIGTLKYGYDEQIRGLPPMPAPRDAQE